MVMVEGYVFVLFLCHTTPEPCFLCCSHLGATFTKKRQTLALYSLCIVWVWRAVCPTFVWFCVTVHSYQYLHTFPLRTSNSATDTLSIVMLCVREACWICQMFWSYWIMGLLLTFALYLCLSRRGLANPACTMRWWLSSWSSSLGACSPLPCSR